jgi:hypothetical protein
MEPARYAAFAEALKANGKGCTLLRLGPYTQARHASQDTDRPTAALVGRGNHRRARMQRFRAAGPFNVSDHELFTDPYEDDAVTLLAGAAA